MGSYELFFVGSVLSLVVAGVFFAAARLMSWFRSPERFDEKLAGDAAVAIGTFFAGACAFAPWPEGTHGYVRLGSGACVFAFVALVVSTLMERRFHPERSVPWDIRWTAACIAGPLAFLGGSWLASEASLPAPLQACAAVGAGASAFAATLGPSRIVRVLASGKEDRPSDQDSP